MHPKALLEPNLLVKPFKRVSNKKKVPSIRKLVGYRQSKACQSSHGPMRSRLLSRKQETRKLILNNFVFGSSRTSLSRMGKPSFFSFSCLNLFSLVVSCKRLHLLRHRFDMMSHRDRRREARPNLSQLTHEVASKGFHQSSGEKQKNSLNWC